MQFVPGRSRSGAGDWRAVNRRALKYQSRTSFVDWAWEVTITVPAARAPPLPFFGRVLTRTTPRTMASEPEYKLTISIHYALYETVAPSATSCWSVPDTWVTVYSEDIGSTFGPKGKAPEPNSDAQEERRVSYGAPTSFSAGAVFCGIDEPVSHSGLWCRRKGFVSNHGSLLAGVPATGTNELILTRTGSWSPRLKWAAHGDLLSVCAN